MSKKRRGSISRYRRQLKKQGQAADRLEKLLVFPAPGTRVRHIKWGGWGSVVATGVRHKEDRIEVVWNDGTRSWEFPSNISLSVVVEMGNT